MTFTAKATAAASLVNGKDLLFFRVIIKNIARTIFYGFHISSMNWNSKITIRFTLPILCMVLAGCDWNLNRLFTAKSSKPDEVSGTNIYDSSEEIQINGNVPAVLTVPASGEHDLKKEALITNGMKKSDVLAVLGEPKGAMVAGNHTMLVYDGGHIELAGGLVTNLEIGIVTDIQIAQKKVSKQADNEAQQRTKGLVLFEGRWIPLGERDRLIALKQEQEDVERIRRATRKRECEQEERHKKEVLEKFYNSLVVCDVNGEPIDHSDLIAKGKITVVVFYLPWCDPWRQLSKPLEVLVKSNRDVILKKVDIGHWGSLASKKYNAKSVPDVRVFDRQGRIVGPPDSSISKIKKYIEDAKSRVY